jgi:hypothetical protein
MKKFNRLLLSDIFVGVLIVFLSSKSQADNTVSLCKAKERVIFSCNAHEKIVSLCAKEDLRREAGSLTYRFGKSNDAPELEYSNGSSPLNTKFSYEYDGWAKGSSLTVSFKRGEYSYFVNHAAGAFGVDGGPNRAGVEVLKNNNRVAYIACNEETAVDHLEEELGKAGLPTVLVH